MVRQIKKIVLVCSCVLILIGATCTTVSAADYSTYDGNLSTTQLTYFRDILAGESILDNYVVFRDGQYSYEMVVGKISYSNGSFTSNEQCKVYSLDTGGNYNSYYTLKSSTISNFNLNTSDRLVYSDLEGFPQLEERGQKYEILTTILICICCVCFVVRCIFYPSRRR